MTSRWPYGASLMPHRHVILVSGDGSGAGKTTLASRFKGQHLSLAGAMRTELQVRYPAYDWFRRDQEYKSQTVIVERGPDATMRQVLLEYGQQQCAEHPWYWARRLVGEIFAGEPGTYIIDDVRKTCEAQEFRAAFANVVHFHINHAEAVHEPEFEAAALAQLADYVVEWHPDAAGRSRAARVVAAGRPTNCS